MVQNEQQIVILKNLIQPVSICIYRTYGNNIAGSATNKAFKHTLFKYFPIDKEMLFRKKNNRRNKQPIEIIIAIM